MKTGYLLLIVALLFRFTLSAEDKLGSNATDTEKELIQSVNKRLNYGDKRAITEISKMRPSIAIPYLAYYTDDRSTDRERAEIARLTLAKIPGLEDYYRPILAVPIKEDFDAYGRRLKAFRVLSILKTKEALRIIVSSLFDESVSHPDLPSDVKGGGPIKYEAVEVLKQMELPSAPKEKFTAYYEEDAGKKLAAFRDAEVGKWRAWWDAHKAEYQ